MRPRRTGRLVLSSEPTLYSGQVTPEPLFKIECNILINYIILHFFNGYDPGFKYAVLFYPSTKLKGVEGLFVLGWH